MSEPKLGIIAGGGILPLSVARSATGAGRDVHVIGIEGEADQSIGDFPHSWMKWGELGRLLKILKDEQVGIVVIIGSVTRPDMSQVRMDFGAIRNLPFILGLMTGGDNSVLGGIVKFFERHGLTVMGAHEVAPDLVCPEGVLGSVVPSDDDKADIDLASKVIEALGPFDVGQGAVAARQHVIAIEAAEGTDVMLRRCADLRQWGTSKRRRVGVLVKRPKPSQELRIDLPTIGSRTVELAAAAGLAGIVAHSGHVLLADKEQLIEEADRHNIFVMGADLLGDMRES